ncbi:MAG: hypothetical protein NTX53_21400, partial [candidate division WOR-3 bacterium]|nr:hypothetical protein [candidate division WOR-3 bacterium]
GLPKGVGHEAYSTANHLSVSVKAGRGSGFTIGIIGNANRFVCIRQGRTGFEIHHQAKRTNSGRDVKAASGAQRPSFQFPGGSLQCGRLMAHGSRSTATRASILGIHLISVKAARSSFIVGF